MFWEKSYSQSQNIENLLQKENVTVEELLDDEDILQECKLQTRRLIQFLTRPDVIKRLIMLTITEPPENLSVAERFKYSNTACELLTFGIPSLDEKIVEDTEILQTLYSFLENEPPLNPLLAAFFSKTFSMLISKKSEQDWFLYQKMCLQLLEFIKSRENFLDLIFKHFATPVIMDLLLQIIKEVQGGALKKNLYEWLTEQKLVERVINILGNPKESEKHANVTEFVIELIKHGRSMRQSVQEDTFESAFTGTDPLLQVLEDEIAITQLLNVILDVNPQESSIVAGIQIVLTLVDESIVDEPASDKALKKMIDKEKDNHERVVYTVIQTISPRIQDFHRLLLEPPIKNDITIPSPVPIFGLTRLQICRLFTVLLQTGNSNIVDTICETDYFNTLLNLFKQYSWNNFLHSEVGKCLRYVFAVVDQNENENNQDTIETGPSALQKHVITNCKIISKLVDCWLHNTEAQLAEHGRRLGYMGHLIQILDNITRCISNSDHIGALIESSLDNDELANWKSLIDPEVGELTKELKKQTKLLADCDPKSFQHDNIIVDHDNGEINYTDGLDDQGSPLNESPISKYYEYLDSESVINCLMSSSEEIAANLQRTLKVWGSNLNENFEDDMDLERFGIDASKIEANSLNMPINPWGTGTFTNSATVGANAAGGSSNNSGTNEIGGWADFTPNNFADFESHFNSFTSDYFGDKFDSSQEATAAAATAAEPEEPSKEQEEEEEEEEKLQQRTIETETVISMITESTDDADDQPHDDKKILIEKSDKNANVEKIPFDSNLIDQTELETKNAKNIDLQNFENQNDETITTPPPPIATPPPLPSQIEFTKGNCNEQQESTLQIAPPVNHNMMNDENAINSHENEIDEINSDVEMKSDEIEGNRKDDDVVVSNGPSSVIPDDVSDEKKCLSDAVTTNRSTTTEEKLNNENQLDNSQLSATKTSIESDTTAPKTTTSSMPPQNAATVELPVVMATSNNKTPSILENGPI